MPSARAFAALQQQAVLRLWLSRLIVAGEMKYRYAVAVLAFWCSAWQRIAE